MFLSYETALLLALGSTKPVGDLHALPSCTQFSVGLRVILCTNVAFT